MPLTNSNRLTIIPRKTSKQFYVPISRISTTHISSSLAARHIYSARCSFPQKGLFIKVQTISHSVQSMRAPIINSQLFFSKNITTGMMVSAARGVALVAVAERTDNLYEYTPMQIKQAVTSYGKADKQQVQMMVRMMLGMNETPRPDDAADALAVAITHANSMRAGHLFKIR